MVENIITASIMKDACGTDFPPAGGVARVFLRSAVLMFGLDKALTEARDVMYIENPSSKRRPVAVQPIRMCLQLPHVLAKANTFSGPNFCFTGDVIIFPLVVLSLLLGFGVCMPILVIHRLRLTCFMSTSFLFESDIVC